MNLSAPRNAKLPPFDPFAPGFCQDPYAFYARYRQHEPIHWQADQGGGGRWYVFRHADVAAVLTNAALGRERGAPDPSAEKYPAYSEMISRWMLFRDPPHHTRVRDAFNKALVKLGMKLLRPGIERLAGRQVAQLRGASCDVIADFAFTLPVLVVAELIGIPERDRDSFRAWSKCFAASIDMAPGPEVLAAADRAAEEVTRYLRGVFAERRREPRADLVSALVEGQGESGPDDEDLIANCVLLLSAGHETTTNLIANGVLALLQNPDQAELLRTRPEAIDSAVEEFLRFDSAVQMTTRTVLEDTELAGTRFKRGQHVNLVLGSANRDSAVFASPDRLDILRSPNPQVAFGVGRHYCIGAPLARLVAKVAIPALQESFPNMQLAEPEPAWRRNVAFRGLERLPVKLG